MHRLVVLLALAAALAAPTAARAANPPVKHVFVIMLENKSYNETFGTNAGAPYLANRLASRGVLVPNFYGVTHFSLGNYLAMIGGQGSNPQTQVDCQFYNPVVPGTIGPDGQALGSGCVFPSSVKSLGDQLTAAHRTWKGYMQDMGTPCRHPALFARDTTQQAKKGDQYAARHNPFVYYASITGSPQCAKRDVDLSALPRDLRRVSTTPNFSLIVPNLCEDGHDAPCVDGRPGGLKSADAFLRRWVPRIRTSPAYLKDGLLIITWDEAETSGTYGDATACCNEPQFPNTPNNGGPTLQGRGGGRIGAVMTSPWIDGGTITTRAYNHFSLLRSVEDMFRLGHLGYAARSGLRTFGADVFTCNPPRNARLIRRVTVDRGTRKRSTVEVRLNRKGTARVYVGKRRVGTRSGRRCNGLRFVMPRGHGYAHVRAGRDSRKVAY